MKPALNIAFASIINWQLGFFRLRYLCRNDIVFSSIGIMTYVGFLIHVSKAYTGITPRLLKLTKLVQLIEMVKSYSMFPLNPVYNNQLPVLQ